MKPGCQKLDTLLTCPKCSKHDPAGVVKIPFDHYDKRITCKHCKKLVKATQWLCPCGSPWFKCSKHDNVIVITNINRNESDPQNQNSSKSSQGTKRKDLSNGLPQESDSSRFQKPVSKRAKHEMASMDIETLRKDETRRYRFAHSNAISAKRKTPIVLGEADFVMPTQLGPILKKRFRKMDAKSFK